MIRTTLAIAYFSYLLLGGTAMTKSMNEAEHASAASFNANMCRLMADSAACQL